MQAHELMTTYPASCTPEQKVQDAARMMREHDCGLIPVVETASARVVGVVTDRDIALRVIAEGKGADTPVQQAMSGDPSCCRVDDDIVKVKEVMAERRVRRVPVIDAEGRCVGIIAQADLLLSAERHRSISQRDVARVVERISEPDQSPRANADVGERPARRAEEAERER